MSKTEKLQENKLTTCARCSCRKRRWCWRIPGLSPWTLDRAVQSGGLLQNIVTNKDLVIYWTHKFHNSFERKNKQKRIILVACHTYFPQQYSFNKVFFHSSLLISTYSEFPMMEINAGLIATGAQPVAVLIESSKREKFCWVKSHYTCHFKTIQQAVHTHFPWDGKTFL